MRRTLLAAAPGPVDGRRDERKRLHHVGHLALKLLLCDFVYL